MIKGNPRGILIAVIIFFIVLSTGCWNNRELTERSIILATGIDKSKDGKGFRITIELPIFISGEGGKAKVESWVTYEEGETIFHAIRNFPFHIGRKIFWGHNQVLFIGEDVAKEGLLPAIDFFSRDHEARLDPYLVIVRGNTAEEIMKNLKGETATLGSQQVENSLMAQGATSQFHTGTILDVYTSMITDGLEPSTAAIIKGSEDKAYELSGTALFKKDKLVAWLNKTESRGLNWMTDDVEGGLIVISLPHKKNAWTLEILKSTTKPKVEIIDGEIFFKPQITVAVNIGEITFDIDLADKKQREVLENAAKRIIFEEMNLTLKVLQELKTDSVGIGSLINKNDHKLWKIIKNTWEEEYFPYVKLKPEITIEPRQKGLLIKS